MSDLPPGLHPGVRVACVLADGQVFTGICERARKGWLRLRNDDQSAVLLNLAHVALIRPLGTLRDEPEADDSERPTPRSKDRPSVAGAGAPGRAWSDTELKAIAEAFLDGRLDAELATELQRPKAALKEMRQGFECARGNLVEEEISPIARTWVPRWRRVLAG